MVVLTSLLAASTQENASGMTLPHTATASGHITGGDTSRAVGAQPFC